jgi:hypothetical protein
MAKVDTQSIPSELRIKYKRGAQIATTLRGQDYVRTRYPWRIPHMQAGGAGVTSAQQTQRDKFSFVRGKYGLLTATAKARWAAANPEYHSYLFGYNFFMLEGLLGGGPIQYPDVIKSIQVVKKTMSKSGNTEFDIDSVDPAKCVVLIAGNSHKYANVQRGSSTITDGGSNNHALSPSVDPDVCEVIVTGHGGREEISEGSGEGDWGSPYASALSASQLTVAMAATGMTITTGYSWQVIEHVEQTVFPVLVSIAATKVTMAWAIEPSLASDVSITVVEYL